MSAGRAYQRRFRRAIRAGEVVAALRLAISAAEDAGDEHLAQRLLELMLQARRRADALDRAVDEVAAAA